MSSPELISTTPAEVPSGERTSQGASKAKDGPSDSSIAMEMETAKESVRAAYVEAREEHETGESRHESTDNST